MAEIINQFRKPATESHVGLGLGVAAVALALMLWAVVWQSSVIAFQRDLIQMLWSAKAGG